jgi:hypothetical protein
VTGERSHQENQDHSRDRRIQPVALPDKTSNREHDPSDRCRDQEEDSELDHSATAAMDRLAYDGGNGPQISGLPMKPTVRS